MSNQTDFDDLVSAAKNFADQVKAIADKFVGLGIPAPVDTSAAPAVKEAMNTALTALSAAFDAEAGKLAPPAPPPAA